MKTHNFKLLSLGLLTILLGSGKSSAALVRLTYAGVFTDSVRPVPSASPSAGDPWRLSVEFDPSSHFYLASSTDSYLYNLTVNMEFESAGVNWSGTALHLNTGSGGAIIESGCPSAGLLCEPGHGLSSLIGGTPFDAGFRILLAYGPNPATDAATRLPSKLSDWDLENGRFVNFSFFVQASNPDGGSLSSGRFTSVVLEPIPEPATTTLILASVLLGKMRWRDRMRKVEFDRSAGLLAA